MFRYTRAVRQMHTSSTASPCHASSDWAFAAIMCTFFVSYSVNSVYSSKTITPEQMSALKKEVKKELKEEMAIQQGKERVVDGKDDRMIWSDGMS